MDSTLDKYYFVAKYDVYKSNSHLTLSKELEKLGFTYKQPEMGGGGGEVINHILAYLSLDTTRDAIASGLLTNLVWKVLETAYNWHKAHKLPNKQINPNINVYIYANNKQESYFLNLDLNEKPSKKTIVHKIKNEIHNKKV